MLSTLISTNLSLIGMYPLGKHNLGIQLSIEDDSVPLTASTKSC